MKKRILALLLTMVMLFGAMPLTAFATEASNATQPTAEGTEPAAETTAATDTTEPSADALAAAQVITLIDAIGVVTLESEAAIAAADGAYKALTEKQKALVTNLDVLEAAKATYGTLHEPEAIAATAIYNYQNDGVWHAGSNYAKKVSVDGATVQSSSWSGDTCTVILASDTSLTQKVKLKFAVSGSISVTIDGSTKDGAAITFSNIALVDGSKTVTMTITADGVSVTKTIVMRVAGTGEPDPTPDSSEPEGPSRNNGELFNKEIDGDWSVSNNGAWVTTVKLTGATVRSVQWNGNTCAVVLGGDTPADASVTLIVAVDGARQVVMRTGVSIDGTVQANKQGTVQLQNGQKTVEIKFGITNGEEVTKTFVLSVEGGGAKNEKPTRKEGVEATATYDAYTGVPFSVKLTDIFADADGDALTYSVKIAGKTESAAAEYSYTPTASGKQTLVFTANDGKADSEDTFTVTLNVKESSIALDQSEAEVDLGSSLTLTATVVPESTAAIWSSSDEAVAKVANGLVTPVAKGTAIITASAAGKTATCTVTVEDPNELKAKVTITINNQGVLELINKSLTVLDQDNDGALTYHDALVLLHEEYDKAYVAEESAFGLFVTTMWDVQTGGSCYFYLNNESIPNSVGTDTVKDGDYLYATNMVDLYGYSDVQTYFSDSYKTVFAGEEFTLTLFGGMMDWETFQPVEVPFSGIQIGTYSDFSGGNFTALEGKTTDANGQVTLSFDAPGTYILSATGSYADGTGMEYPIMPPVCVVTVKPAEVTSVTLDKTSHTMTINSTYNLQTTVLPANAADKSLTWTSSDESVATVSRGQISAKKVGTTTITATAKNGVYASCLVTVELADPAEPANVTITISNRGVLALANAAVTVTDRDSDGKLTYDEALIAAHETYCPDGYAVNYATGWVYKMWGVDSSNLLFMKNDIPLSRFVADNASVVSEGDALYAGILMYETSYLDLYTRFDQKTVTVKQGQSFELALTGYVAAHTGSNPKWKAVSGAAIGLWTEGGFEAMEGKVTDADGKVTLSLETPGTYIVSAYYDDQSAPLMAPVCVVTVSADTALTLSKTELILTVGQEETLTATVTPAEVPVTWISSDETVATVVNGKVTALKPGSATITVKAGDQEKTCLVTVEEEAAPAPLRALRFTAGTTATSAEFELRPAFSPEVREYTLIVPDSKNAISVWATLAEGQTGAIKALYTNTSNAAKTVSVTSGGTRGASLSSVLKYSLDGTSITITVAGEEAYTITVVRKATLKTLSLSYGEENTVALSPEFSADQTQYSARVPGNTAITVTPAGRISTSSITVNGTQNTVVTPVWNGLSAEIEIVVSGGTGKPDVIPTTYKIQLSQCAVSLEILTPPTKTEYAAGETFDPAGMTLTATYSDGSTETIGADQLTYSDDALAPGTTEVEVGFDGLTVEQPVTIPNAFEGEGTQEDPYLIKTVEDLVRLSEMVADGLSFSGEHFKMVADITLPENWSPIGSGINKRFCGSFDGDGHLLTVPEGGLPLLGYVKDAYVRNLNIYGTKIAGYGLVNNLEGINLEGNAITIENVTLKSGSSTLKSGLIGTYLTTNPHGGCSMNFNVTIRNCTIEAGVIIGYNKDQSAIGSFAGRMNGTIENCTSNATVYGVDSVGGILGTRDNSLGNVSISNCTFGGTVTASGTYVGGIAGSGYLDTTGPNAMRTNINNCVSTGSVTGGDKVGGILGGDNAAQTWNAYTFKNNTFTGTVRATSGTYVGGIIGYYRSLNKFDDITGNYYASGCGATKGIGGVELVDTNCTSHETDSGVTYLNTQTSTAGCPAIAGCNWKTAHNRTDDPLGADRTKLCYTDTDLDPIATDLKISGTYKTEFNEGEDLDLTGIVLTVHYNWGDPKTVELKDATISGYDKTKVGNQTVTIAYGGLTADITVTVKSTKKEITVTVSVLGDSIHNSDADGKVHTLAAGNLTPWLSGKQVVLEPAATAFDALKKALDAAGIPFTYEFTPMYNSNYIDSINGLAEFTNGENSGWMITVNGVHISVGVSAYTLQDGDVIVMHYTDDFTKENGGMGEEDDTAAIKEAEKLIDAIGTVTLDKADEIEAARKAYDGLSYAQKQKVTNHQKLTNAEAKLKTLQEEADQAEAKKVKDLISKLDQNSITFEADVKKAKKAYDDLTTEQKKLVDNGYILTGALKVLADAEDLKAAETVEKLIDEIGTVSSDSEEAIKAAREAYDKLTDGQKALVENLEILEAAEEKLEQLKAAALGREAYEVTGDYLEELGTPAPGSVGGEWMVIGLIRSGREIMNEDAYYDAAVQFVRDNIDENGRLHQAKSTENARMILALTALGKDVTDVGGYNLLTGLNSMEYIRKQGINGPIWALIALDSGNYPAPEGDVTREALIGVILEKQLPDGGWALSGDISDPDMTGMALQALAPYYDSDPAVKKAVDAALITLSDMQAADGSYASVDGSSSESVAQVVTALAALGIDADTAPRFIKNGVSAFDALCAFFVEGGGFKHVPDGKLDGMATEQSYYALTAYYRMLDGKTALFNMTDVVDLGGDVIVEEPEETLPAETEAANTEPVQKVAKDDRSFPWWLVIVIVVLAGVIVVLAIAIAPRKRRS